MKKSHLLFLLICNLLHFVAFAQPSYVPGVQFCYDLGGNRQNRQILTFCIGTGCPAGSPTPTAGCSSSGLPSSRMASHSDASSQNQSATVEAQIIAYPNPVEQNLSVENKFWRESDKVILVVTDIVGKTIMTQELFQAKGNVSFLKLIPGSYLVQYYLNSSLAQVWKIVKIK